MKEREDHIRNHFQTEADIFDERVVRIVPYYREMLEALVSAIPFEKHKAIRVADLGSGTGTVAYLVKKRFPRAHITCVDLSENMLAIAARKLKGSKNVVLELGELKSYKFKGKYDAIVSSLAMHHIEPGKGKAAVYKKIWSALRKGGVFVNADIIISSDKKIQDLFLGKWAEFILRSFSK